MKWKWNKITWIKNEIRWLKLITRLKYKKNNNTGDNKIYYVRRP